MLTLFHHPDCPHSRFVRLALREYGLTTRQVVERTWQRREEFLMLNPAGTTPVLVTEDGMAVAGASVIAEYLDELYGEHLGNQRLLPQELSQRIEVRRLSEWFNLKYFNEVSGPLLLERYKLYMTVEGSGRRDFPSISAARRTAADHVDYIGLLLGNRRWLAGGMLTYADLAAAAHLSTTEYFCKAVCGDNDAAREWYERMQARPSFRTILGMAWRTAM